jgi:hypothetical protein
MWNIRIFFATTARLVPMPPYMLRFLDHTQVDTNTPIKSPLNE